MNRVPILAIGAVLACFLLCAGALTVADTMSRTPVSNVLSIGGVSTTPAPSANDSTPQVTPTESAAPAPAPDGVVVVQPSDPTRIDGSPGADVRKHRGDGVSDDATEGSPSYSHGGWTHHHHRPHVTGSPVPQDPESTGSSSIPSASPTSDSDDVTDDQGDDTGDDDGN